LPAKSSSQRLSEAVIWKTFVVIVCLFPLNPDWLLGCVKQTFLFSVEFSQQGAHVVTKMLMVIMTPMTTNLIDE
jgi:hypothetical protein